MFDAKKNVNTGPELLPEEQKIIASAAATIERVQAHRKAAMEKVNQARRALHEAEAAMIEDLASDNEPRDLTPHRERVRDAEADLKAADEAVQQAMERSQRIERETLTPARERILGNYQTLVGELDAALETAAQLSREVRDFAARANAAPAPLHPLPDLAFPPLHSANVGAPDASDSRLGAWRTAMRDAFAVPPGTPEGMRCIRIVKPLQAWADVPAGYLFGRNKPRPWPEGVPMPSQQAINVGDMIGVPEAAAREFVRHQFAEYVEA